ncbi:MAG: DUF3786 domain-containing protein [Clostridiales bacterium]|jgi:hypothetical protein|nr:DUF3786 domain-containing protein [Clostridiales bacterium]
MDDTAERKKIVKATEPMNAALQAAARGAATPRAAVPRAAAQRVAAPKAAAPRAVTPNAMAPFLHYGALYGAKDALEIEARCAVPFDRRRRAFALRIMGRDYFASHPDFALESCEAERREITSGEAANGVDAGREVATREAASGVGAGHEAAGGVDAGRRAADAMEKLLALRYLCEGAAAPWGGRMISYGEIPWGNVYSSNFQGRCVRRLAADFGNDAAGLAAAMAGEPRLEAERVSMGDIGFRFAFMRGLYMAVTLWEGDDEFPPSAQMLFSDNFPAAFTAEDTAVAAEVALGRLRELRAAPRPGGPAT